MAWSEDDLPTTFSAILATFFSCRSQFHLSQEAGARSVRRSLRHVGLLSLSAELLLRRTAARNLVPLQDRRGAVPQPDAAKLQPRT